MHRESMKVTVMSRWPLYEGDRYGRFDCNYNESLEWLYPFITDGRFHDAYYVIFKKNTR